MRTCLIAAQMMVLSLSLLGCEPTLSPAPVGTLGQVPTARNHYMVRPGDTLYSIAWAYQLDPQALSDLNELDTPDSLRSNQVLRLPTKQDAARAIVTKQVVAEKKSHIQHKVITKSIKGHIVWQWPVKKGRMRIAPKPYHGLLFAHDADLRVRAAASGRVVYSGTGIRGYGHLLLLDHGSGVLSAYGFNEAVYVQVGDQVGRGHIMAKVGVGPMGRWLYFEVRKQGRPMSAKALMKAMRS